MSPRTLHLLQLLDMDPHWRDPNPDRGRVTAMQHALQAATRARRIHPDDHELVVAALLHDAARPLTDARHGEAIAEILADRVRPDVTAALRHHGEFQRAILDGLPMPHMDEPWFHVGIRLATVDAASFDPDYQPDPLNSFLPDLDDVLRGP